MQHILAFESLKPIYYDPVNADKFESIEFLFANIIFET